MRKSEKVAAQFSSVIRLLELADGEMQSIREMDPKEMEQLSIKFCVLLEEVEDVMYTTCAPIEMAEEETDQEIRRLEKRLADLKASR